MGQENTEELLRRIKELESEKAYLNAQLKQENRFGLQWIDVPEAFDVESENKIPILEEVPELAITNDDGKPTHILIEGDNYHALTCLNYTHHGKVDVIYIDPPYNTGKDGFTYKDSRFLDLYPDGSELPPNHPLRHSSWLSFMEKRLRLAKELLVEDGLVFISIGDDEQANLKLLCDKIFNEKNFIETYIWNSISRPDNSSPILRRNAEFILCYAKNKSNIIEFKGIASPTTGMPSLTKSKETLVEIEFPTEMVRTTLADGVYYAGVKENGGNPEWELMNDVHVVDGRFVENLRIKGHSYWKTQKKIQEEMAEGTEIWIKTESFVPYYKKIKDAINRPTKILPTEYVKEGIFGNTELNSNIFNTKIFSNPKPSTLISFLANFIPKKNGLILDFFAGSGTTMQAVMALNEIDFGKRQCILVQYPELTYEIKDGKKIAKKGSDNAFNAGFDTITKITYERNKRVINGYHSKNNVKEEIGRFDISISILKDTSKLLKEVEELKDGYNDKYDSFTTKIEDNSLIVEGVRKKENAKEGMGNSLKYYRTSFVGDNVSTQATDNDKTVLAQKAGCLLALAENTLYEQKKTNNYQIFKDKDKDVWTAVYFKEDYRPQYFNEFVDVVKGLKGIKNVYIFSWGDVGSFESYFDDDSHINIKGIPQPILDIYKSLNS